MHKKAFQPFLVLAMGVGGSFDLGECQTLVREAMAGSEFMGRVLNSAASGSSSDPPFILMCQ